MTRVVVAVAGAIGGAGAGLGYAAINDPLVLVTVPTGVVFIGAAIGIGVGLAVGLAELVQRLLGSLGRVSKSAETQIEVDDAQETFVELPPQKQI